MNKREERVLKQTRLRNLKRKYAKMIQIPSLVEECIELKCEIDSLKRELKC